MSEPQRHLPVSGPRADDALARPTRSLDELTDDDIDQLVADAEPSRAWELFVLQGGIIGIIGTCVATGVIPFAWLLKLGAPAWVALIGLVVGAIAGVPIFGVIVALFGRVAHARMLKRHRRAIAWLNVDEASGRALLKALNEGASIGERRGSVEHMLAGSEEPFDPVVGVPFQREPR